MANSLMNTGMSGLNAAQNMLNVVSNNISNAHTVGYNRQKLALSQANGTLSAAGFIGNGVAINSVNRVYNQFVVNQLRQADAQSGAASTYYTQLSKVDTILASSDNGISGQLQSLFSSLNTLSNNAGDVAGRQSVVSNIQALVNQFNQTDTNLKNQISSVNNELANDVDTINTYTQQIAELNQKIARLQGASGGDDPNQLLDQRDQLVNELNQIIGVTVSEQQSQYTLSIGNGLSLVHGTTVNQLAIAPSAADPALSSIIYTFSSGATQALNTNTITSGSINGLLLFRDGPLTDARNQLGLVALNLAERFNQVQRNGVDINGEPGQDLFSFSQPNTIVNRYNQGNSTLVASYDAVTKMQAADYRIEYTGSDWSITRLSDNASLTPTLINGQLQFDGLVMTISGTPVAGDSFIVKPLANVATSLTSLISDPEKLAAGIDDAQTGFSDNRNITNMLGIQSEKLLGGKATLNQGYATLVSFIGSATSSAKIVTAVNDSIVGQLNEQNQSISGVNIDEEYIAMQVYMQYYQANAKVIDVATTLLDTILGLA